ncbi:MAG: hypothetical protein QE273_00815 [Verrucomicrobiales bacterium]|nr:hypothetical protein [Verrucomicrobiales bacterium]
MKHTLTFAQILGAISPPSRRPAIRSQLNPLRSVPTPSSTPRGAASGTCFPRIAPAPANPPFLKIPTDTEISRRELKGGLILPFSVELADGVEIGLFTESVGVVGPDDDEAYFPRGASFSVSADLVFDAGIQVAAREEDVTKRLSFIDKPAPLLPHNA